MIAAGAVAQEQRLAGAVPLGPRDPVRRAPYGRYELHARAVDVDAQARRLDGGERARLRRRVGVEDDALDVPVAALHERAGRVRDDRLRRAPRQDRRRARRDDRLRRAPREDRRRARDEQQGDAAEPPEPQRPTNREIRFRTTAPGNRSFFARERRQSTHPGASRSRRGRPPRARAGARRGSRTRRGHPGRGLRRRAAAPGSARAEPRRRRGPRPAGPAPERTRRGHTGAGARGPRLMSRSREGCACPSHRGSARRVTAPPTGSSPFATPGTTSSRSPLLLRVVERLDRSSQPGGHDDARFYAIGIVGDETRRG